MVEGRPRTQPADVRREQLLDAAEQVLVARGLRSTTVADVAAAAGVAKGTTYLYFASKDDLLAGLRARYLERFAAALDARPARHGDRPAAPPRHRAVRLRLGPPRAAPRALPRGRVQRGRRVHRCARAADRADRRRGGRGELEVDDPGSQRRTCSTACTGRSSRRCTATITKVVARAAAARPAPWPTSRCACSAGRRRIRVEQTARHVEHHGQDRTRHRRRQRHRASAPPSASRATARTSRSAAAPRRSWSVRSSGSRRALVRADRSATSSPT